MNASRSAAGTAAASGPEDSATEYVNASLSASVAVTAAPTLPDAVFSATVRDALPEANTGASFAAPTGPTVSDAVCPDAEWVTSV